MENEDYVELNKNISNHINVKRNIKNNIRTRIYNNKNCLNKTINNNNKGYIKYQSMRLDEPYVNQSNK